MTCHVVVPAAGAGRRFGAAVPKQYLLLAGRTIMQHTLDRLTAMPGIARVVVVIAADDPRPAALAWAHPERLQFVVGGAERMDSVLAGLDALRAEGVPEGDWVLVHDVARPLLRADDVARLIRLASAHAVGGLLAHPVRDTMKRADAAGQVAASVPREQLWHALTPQMFRLGELREALLAARRDGAVVTDEASALERLGRLPLLVEGALDNLKITYPDDLALAEALLQSQRQAGVAP